MSLSSWVWQSLFHEGGWVDICGANASWKRVQSKNSSLRKQVCSPWISVSPNRRNALSDLSSQEAPRWPWQVASYVTMTLPWTDIFTQDNQEVVWWAHLCLRRWLPCISLFTRFLPQRQLTHWMFSRSYLSCSESFSLWKCCFIHVVRLGTTSSKVRDQHSKQHLGQQERRQAKQGSIRWSMSHLDPLHMWQCM